MGRKTIRAYMTITVMYKLGVSFINAFYATFLLSKGLTLFQVNMVNAVFMATMFVAEVPTGAIADMFGRRISLFFAFLLQAVGMVMYAHAGSFWSFALAESFCAVGSCCSTGAFEAWFVDSLKHHGFSAEDLQRKVLPEWFGKAAQVGQALGIVAGMVGAWLANIYPALPWYLGAGVLLAGAILALCLMKEDYFTPKGYSIRGGFYQMWATMRSGMSYAATHPSVRFIMVLSLLQSIAVMAPNMQWQPFFLPHVGSKAALGWVWGGMGLFLFFGAGLTSRFLRLVRSEKWAIVIAQAVIAVGVVATASMNRVAALAMIVFFCHELPRGMWQPMTKVYVNHHVPSEERATIGSCGAVLSHLGAAIGLTCSGLLAERASIPVTWIVMGSFLLVSTLLVAVVSKHD